MLIRSYLKRNNILLSFIDSNSKHILTNQELIWHVNLPDLIKLSSI